MILVRKAFNLRLDHAGLAHLQVASSAILTVVHIVMVIISIRSPPVALICWPFRFLVYINFSCKWFNRYNCRREGEVRGNKEAG